MKLGVNLTQPADWTCNLVWKDQMRQARYGRDKNQWLMRTDDPARPAGKWLLEWSGDVMPKLVRGFANWDAIHPGVALCDAQPVDVFKGFAIEPAFPSQTISLWCPGVNRDGSPFHPDYEAMLNPNYENMLRGFDTLRFMDWQATNASSLTYWDERRRPDEQQQWQKDDSKGVAIEHCLDLAHRVSATPWLCVPHMATDDFVAEMGKLIENSRLVCWLEYSNEFWNTAPAFKGGIWIHAEAKRLGISAAEYYGKRVARISQVLAQNGTLGSSSPVICGQLANPWMADKAASSAHAAGGKDAFDAISCSWYFGVGKTFTGTTVDEVLTACEANIRDVLTPGLKAHADLAAQHQVELVLYEGGQHLTSAGKVLPYSQALLDAQRDPRMGQLYDQALEVVRSVGTELACHYSDVSPATNFGSWGAKQHMLDDDNPKWLALKRAMA